MNCQLCSREAPLTKHHLVPKLKGGRNGDKADLCYACHGQIHTLYSEGKLARNLSSLEALKADENIQKFVEWIKDKPVGHVRMRQANR